MAIPFNLSGTIVSILVLSVALYLGLRSFPRDPTHATYCYQGVQTFSASQEWADCFTVANGKFAKVFSLDPGAKAPGEMSMRAAIPGLWDGHGHLLQYAEFLHSVDLFGSSSIQEVRNRISDYIHSHPGAGTKEQWVRGIGWDQMTLGETPTAALLESDWRLKGLYMMLDRVDVHCVWASQAVLDLLPGDIADVPGGEIVRDPGMGVFCDNSIDMVSELWPKPDRQKIEASIKTAIWKLHQVGLVGMHDAGTSPEYLELFQDMSKTEDWTLRTYAMVECKERNTFCPEEANRLRQESDFLSIRSVKLFADGALGSWGSAMIDPYTDRPDTTGSLLVNASTLTSLAKSWSAAGFQVNIHAIGDLANRYALDAFEAALVDLCPGQSPTACQEAHRFRIEHAQVIHPRDQARMRALNILPSIQPTHATSDMRYARLRLGPERTAQSAYRMRSLLDLGPVLGSDFPVEPPDPFQGIYAAVARKSPLTGEGANGSAEAWHPEEALRLREAVWGFTGAVAYGGFMEGRAGVIQEGAYADWVVLDKPLGKYELGDLRYMEVQETWVGGRRVYAKGESVRGGTRTHICE